MKLAPALLATAAVALAGPAAASAAVSAYDVAYDLTYEYRAQSADAGGFGTQRDAAEWSAKVTGSRTHVPIDDAGQLTGGRGGRYGEARPTALSGAAGRLSFAYDPIDSTKPETGRVCELREATPVGDPEIAPAATSAGPAVLVSGLWSVRVTYRCPPENGADDPLSTDIGALYSGMRAGPPSWVPGPVVTEVAPPTGGQASVTRPVDVTVTGDACPEGAEAGWDDCALRMHGTVTFTRTGTWTGPAKDAPLTKPRGFEASGPREHSDNLFLYRFAEIQLDTTIDVVVDREKADGTPVHGELRMANRIHRRLPKRAPKKGSGGYVDIRNGQGGTVTLLDTGSIWRGRAAFDGGVGERHPKKGIGWQGEEFARLGGRCDDLRWDGRVSFAEDVGGLRVTAPTRANRSRFEIRFPPLPDEIDLCGARELAPGRALPAARFDVSREALRRRTLVLPVKLRDVQRKGAWTRTVRAGGFITLVRAGSCRAAWGEGRDCGDLFDEGEPMPWMTG